MEGPVDLGVLRPGLSVDELPPHVGRRGHAVHLDHVVFPLDSLCGVVIVLGLAGLMVVPVLVVLPDCFAFVVMAVVSVVVVAFVLVLVVAVSVVLVPVPASGCDQVRRQ